MTFSDYRYLLGRVCSACQAQQLTCSYCGGKGLFQYWVSYDELTTSPRPWCIFDRRPVIKTSNTGQSA
jgi:hypothetical protein